MNINKKRFDATLQNLNTDFALNKAHIRVEKYGKGFCLYTDKGITLHKHEYATYKDAYSALTAIRIAVWNK